MFLRCLFHAYKCKPFIASLCMTTNAPTIVPQPMCIYTGHLAMCIYSGHMAMCIGTEHMTMCIGTEHMTMETSINWFLDFDVPSAAQGHPMQQVINTE